MATETFGDLRRELAHEGIRWTVNPALVDSMPITRPPLGLLGRPPQAEPEKRVDVIARVRANPTVNALLALDLFERGVITEKPPYLGRTGHLASPTPAGGAGATTVDWRNRYGWNWITNIRDQDPCEHCWIYGATALVEAMVRIEHCVWCSRSEGDYIEANKVTCGQCGDPTSVLNWVASNGQCDLDCVPWVDRDPGNRSGPYWNPAPGGCGGGSNAPPPAYNPPFDRNGRTVKIPAYTSIGNISDQKSWIQNIGPLVVYFDVYSDFQGWSGNTPYVKSASATYEGGHIMLAVGFNDTLGCWIVKNSWGQYLGDAGYWLIGYGQSGIDSSNKLGVQFTNPDPWTKRRSHGGGMVESGDGALHRNFELIAPSHGNSWTHWWRDNSVSSLPWAKAETIGNDVADPPTFTATTYNRNFEMVYRTTGGRLHHRYFDQGQQKWLDGPIFGPSGATGAVGFIESSWGPGNFEVVTGIGQGQVQHWWRSGSNWQPSVTFGSNILTAGPSLIQSTWGALEFVAVLDNGTMQHWWRDGSTWKSDQIFGANIKSPPVMIQGQFGMENETGNGNFELVVANAQGQVEHWWRDNSNTNFVWSKSATFSSGVSRALALVEGSFGFDLEIVVLCTDGTIQHFWRDNGGWHAGVTIGATL
jgi:Papain family cysteine protease